jgi:hypothetical protein
VSLEVDCAGCGKATPYEVGEGASYGEWLATPLGTCYVRTHRVRECVQTARPRLGGRKRKPPGEGRLADPA